MKYSMFKLAVIGSTTGTIGSDVANTNKPGDFRYLLNTTAKEQARRNSSIPGINWDNPVEARVAGSMNRAQNSVDETTNAYHDYLNWRQQTGRGMPVGVNYDATEGLTSLDTPTQQASNNIFDKNTFNNDRINNIKDPAQLDAYMDFVLKGGFGAQQLQDTDYDPSKMTIADIANNPNAISGLSEALENSSQEARESFLRVTKQYQEAMSNKGGDATNSGNGNATASTSGAGSMSQENMEKLKGSFLKGAWNDIKKDPIGMLPQIASMFLKYIGAGDGIANFFKNPWGFYGTLATLLLGGGMLLSGSDDDEKPVVNNYYNQPAGYNRIPYT